MWLANIPKGPSAKFYVENGSIFSQFIVNFILLKFTFGFLPQSSHYEGTQNDWKLPEGYKATSVIWFFIWYQTTLVTTERTNDAGITNRKS